MLKFGPVGACRPLYPHSATSATAIELIEAVGCLLICFGGLVLERWARHRPRHEDYGVTRLGFQ